VQEGKCEAVGAPLPAYAMFVLATLKDKVKVLPEFFQDDMSKPVISEIQRRYSNKVIAEVGLCVCVHQVLEMGDMYIYPSEGSAYIVTVFNMVVFRPFADEVLSGSIHSISETGMKVSVGFFDEIFVPAHRLPSPHEYESGETEDGEAGAEADRKWVWLTEDGTRLDMEVGDEVRVKVRDVDYHETRKDKYPKVSYDQDGGASRPPSPTCLPLTCCLKRRSATAHLAPDRLSPLQPRLSTAALWSRALSGASVLTCASPRCVLPQLHLRPWSRTRRR